MLPLILFLGLVAATYAYQLLTDPLKAIPGPFWTRFTRFWELRKVRESSFEEFNKQLHDKYGKIVRLAPGRYSIDDPGAAKQIYSHASKFEKARFYYPFGSPDAHGSDMFNTTDIRLHAQLRRRVASMYSTTSLLFYEPFVDNQNKVLADALRKLAAANVSVEIPKWMQFYAFDVIGEMTVGRSFGFLEAGADEMGILRAIHDGSVYGSRVGLFPGLHYYVGLMTKTFRMEIPFNVILNFLNKHISERRSGKQTTDRRDFLSTLLQLRSDDKITERDVVITMGANIAAGSDTTAIGLSSLMRALALHPACLEKLLDEIKEFEAAGQISNPVTFQEAQKMPYLQAVVKESLRLHPATGQPMSRMVPAGGATLAGVHFPGGTDVGVNPWVLHRNPEAFGPDAADFVPERWLDPKRDQSAMQENFFSFGGGARTCIGRNISMLEIYKVVPQLYRQFEFELDEEYGYTKDCVWFVKPDFRMKVRLRSDVGVKT